MGEARNRRIEAAKATRDRFVAELERMAIDEVEGEVDLYREVQSLPAILVPRADPAAIEWMRMKHQECHQNAFSYTKLDPEKRSRMVTGWWCDTAIPKLHSVVERDGQIKCITPGPFSVLTFRPDPLVVMEVGRPAMRNGRRVPVLLRPNPPSTIKAAKTIKALLFSGVAPDDVPEELFALVGGEKITPD